MTVMNASAGFGPLANLTEQEYKRRIWAWTMYDWANSAFATTILAAVLPVYFSQVAGSTLPSATRATTYWSLGLSVSLFVIAILSPILGTIADVMRGKKRFLSIFAGIGIIATALLVLVESGDWVLASILAVIGRIGFNGANVFYDSLLPHVASEEDQDRVSARGFAIGYLGGGLLLAVNIVMIQLLPGTWGARLSFLSVAIWWAVFSIPLFRYVPEPPAAGAQHMLNEGVIAASFRRLRETFADIRQYRELFKYLVAFLIYNDGIGTIISIAAIYGAELGFDSVELILALLLVQFVGIPYSLIFGRLPQKGNARRPFFLAFILFNLIVLPLLGILGSRFLPADIIGARPAPFTGTSTAGGEGFHSMEEPLYSYTGEWTAFSVPSQMVGSDADLSYRQTDEAGARFDFPFNGQRVELIYARGPVHGIWAVELDGEPLLNDSGEPVVIDAYQPTERFELRTAIQAGEPGSHVLSLVNTGEKNPASAGTVMRVGGVEVLPAARRSNLGLIIASIVVIELVGLGFAYLLGRPLFSGLVEVFDTKRSILLALVIYAVIATWGFFLDSVIEYWYLAWMVAIVQGGSQALSRSLYAAMSPAAKSGEFFGFFSVMEKFSAIMGPLLFAAAGTLFGSSRPAILSLIALFFIGGLVLNRVNVDEGKRVAQREDARLAHGVVSN
ncbi:MAG: MFS transporter [Chloroflexi bacterium]|nr:MFS transporter [Chloroflexota bacterium]